MDLLRNEHLETYSLDYSKLRELQYMVETTPAIQECVDLIKYTLFQNVQLEGKPIKEFKDLFANYHVPFYQDALMSCISAGFVIVSTRRVRYEYSTIEENGSSTSTPSTSKDETEDIPDSKKRKVEPEHETKLHKTWASVPVVVPFDSVDVKIHYDTVTNDIAFEVKRTRDQFGLMNSKAPPLRVICFTSINSLVREGIVNSPCSGLLDHFRYMKRLEAMYLQAEYTRSNPSFVLQPANGSSAGAPGEDDYTKATFAYDFVNSSTGGQSGINESARTQALQFGTAHLSVISNYRHHMNSVAQAARTRERHLFDADVTYTQQWHNNTFVVPPGMVMGATPHLPTATVDTAANRMQFGIMVRQKFGFPDSFFRSTGSSGGSTIRTRAMRNTSNTGRNQNASSSQNQDLTPIDLNRFETSIKVYKEFFQKLYRQSYLLCMKVEPPGNIIFAEPPMLKTIITEVIEEAAMRHASRVLDMEQKKLGIALMKKDLETPIPKPVTQKAPAASAQPKSKAPTEKKEKSSKSKDES